MTRQHGSQDLLTPAEVAAVAFVDARTVGRWAREGKIPFERTPGGHRRFRAADVDALVARMSSRVGIPGGAIAQAAADAVVAEAVAIAMEARAEAAAVAVLDIRMAVAVAAETAAAAVIEASRARAIAAAEAARVVAHEAVTAAADIRSRADVHAEHLARAAVEARSLVSSDIDGQAALTAERMAATVQAAAEAASADTAYAAARVAQGVSDAAAQVAEMVAAFELSLEQETASTAKTLRNAALETARQVAEEHGAAMAATPSVDLRRVLTIADAATPVRALDEVTDELRRVFGAEAVTFLIVDASRRALVPLAHSPRAGTTAAPGSDAPALRLSTAHGPAEQSIRTQTVRVIAPEDAWGTAGRWRVMAPVTARGDVLGLLETTFAEAPGAETVRVLAQAGHLLSYVVVANRRHTDLFEWGQRTRPFTLPAEIQQRLLPLSRTCETTAFTLAAWVEPAATIGGDTYDYSLAEDVLHFSLTDAMGHGVDAALTATVCLASLRGSRRVGATLIEEVRTANAAMCAHANAGNDDDFATGLIGRVDLASGVLEVVSAGHEQPILLRAGVASALEVSPGVPLGMFTDATYTSARVALLPGDRIVMVTDGMAERATDGRELLASIESTRDLHPRDAVRTLADAALDTAGGVLLDDATTLCLEWHGMR